MAGNTTASSHYSPSFIKAKTPEELELLMLQNNILNSKVYHYVSIQFVNGFWFAWYDSDNTNKVKIIRKQKRVE